MKACAPAGCVVCRYSATTSHDRFGVVHGSCVAAAERMWPWLGLLTAGRLGGCIVCHTSTVWWHPVEGALHPGCVARAMGLFEADDGVVASVPVVGAPRRGAYARRGAHV